MGSAYGSSLKHALISSVENVTLNKILLVAGLYNFSKYYIFHRPEEAMLFGMVQASLLLEIFPFYRIFENLLL